MAGFYIGVFPAATDDADWAMTLDFTDDTTNAAYDASALTFTLEITDCDQALLTATTTDGTMTRPATNQIAWRFTKAQMGTLCRGQTYKVGCVAVDGDNNTTQIFVADLPVIDGGLA
jgi:hypothetical protein